jgi:hypothetical protein
MPFFIHISRQYRRIIALQQRSGGCIRLMVFCSRGVSNTREIDITIALSDNGPIECSAWSSFTFYGAAAAESASLLYALFLQFAGRYLTAAAAFVWFLSTALWFDCDLAGCINLFCIAHKLRKCASAEPPLISEGQRCRQVGRSLGVRQPKGAAGLRIIVGISFLIIIAWVINDWGEPLW